MMTKNGSSTNHDARPGQTPGELGIQAARAEARQDEARFRGCVHEGANADIGHNPDGTRVVRIDLTYARGPAPMTNTLILTVDAAVALRNQLDGLFAAAGVDDGANDDEDAGPTVDEADACPRCGERHQDCLVWDDDERIHCTNCGTRYEPRDDRPRQTPA